MKPGFRIRDLFPHSKKKVEIKVETKRTVKIRRLSKSVQQVCPICCFESFFISLQEAKCLLDSDEEKWATILSNGNLHLAESPERKILVCCNSVKLEIEKLA